MRVIVLVCVSICVPPLSVRVQSNVASKRKKPLYILCAP